MVAVLEKLFARKKARADLESMRRIFTIPESKNSTLSQIEQEISRNIQGFLSEHVVAGDMQPAEIETNFSDTTIPDDPRFVSEQADFLLNNVVSQSVHTSSPAFIGHMTSAIPYFMFPLAKIMMALNQNLVKIETSKAFTPLERQVIGMLHRLVYEREDSFYKSNLHSRDLSLGTFCSGGTIANLTALWVARNQYFLKRGIDLSSDGLIGAASQLGLKKLVILVSERGHYSIAKSGDLLGIGKDGIVSVPTDEHNKCRLDKLEQTIRSLKNEGAGILAAIGVAGTTETGNVDPLLAMSRLCQNEGIHFHVDAAWGGPTLFSKEHKHLLSGIELADSVTIDAHKQLYVPMGSGMCLFRDPASSKAVEHQANYVIRRGSRDLGRRSLEGSRAGMALLVHSALQIIGREGYELLIDQGIAKAKHFANLIKQRDDFELITEPELNLLTYRFCPADIRKQLETSNDKTSLNDMLNLLNRDIQRSQRQNGKTFVSRTTLKPLKYGGQEIVVFRVALANPLTTPEILDEILREQAEYGAELLK